MAVKKPKDYKTLKNEWYEKLRESGFHDIEQDEFRFKHVSHASYFGREIVRRNYHAKSEYYSMAGQFLNTHKFSSELEKVIWEYHTHGISMRNIAKLLKKVNVDMNKDSVNNVIKPLVVEMKKLYLYKGSNE